MSESQAPETTVVPQCPKCSGDMWDNRESKRNPRAPDFKCKDKSCDGVVWPPREAAGAPGAAAAAGATATPQAPVGDEPACPVCGGRMWDDRASKRNPKAPDFKCRNKPKFQGGPGCPGIIWPPREGSTSRSVTSARPASGGGTSTASRPAARPAPRREDAPSAPPMEYRDFSDAELPDDDELPF